MWLCVFVVDQRTRALAAAFIGSGVKKPILEN